MADLDGLIADALSLLKLSERRQREVEEAEKAYAESLSLRGIAGFIASARKLEEVRKARSLREINATVTMQAYLPTFARIVRLVAKERGLLHPIPDAPCSGERS